MTSPGRVRLGLLTVLLAIWPGVVAAQAPAINQDSDSAQLPRFTLRQIVVGRNDSLVHMPGPWLRAALVALPESVTTLAYRASAFRSGIAPLHGTLLTSERFQHVMGLYRRSEILAASHRTLESMRRGIRSDTTRARFERIFRPRGEWIVDVHDAALAWATTRNARISWESARRALVAAGLIARKDGLARSEAPARALYGLAVLAATDSAAFERVRGALWRTDSASAVTVLTLLSGYTASQQWYTEALGFFLREPWDSTGGGRSIADYVRDDWSSGRPQSAADVEAPEVQTRWFGYPQAVPHYGVPQALFWHLVRLENESATEWLARHGEAGFLRTLRRLPPGDTSLTLLRSGSETLRLTTVPRQSRESLNGFLEPRDAIAIDPGYSPLLALGAVVHEWQHLVFRRRQLEAVTGKAPGFPASVVELPGIQPYLAEGFAEWSAERILAPLVSRWPLLGLGELEKRAGLVRRGGAEDQHAVGYALVHALGQAMGSPAATTDLLLGYAEYPAGVMNEPRLQKAWRQYQGAPGRTLAAPGHRLLIPEVTFTIQHGFPDVVATRILVPMAAGEQR